MAHKKIHFVPTAPQRGPASERRPAAAELKDVAALTADPSGKGGMGNARINMEV